MLKKIIPKKVLNLRHLFYAWWGAVKYKHPSEEMLVIGVTGTSGKSSTVYLLRQLLEAAGFTVGSLSTIDFYIAGENKLNDKKMTMLGKMQIQKFLREMVTKKCDIAIVETTSEGRVQHRHRFVNYDIMVLTNLYPEHIDSHGSFENYMQAKLDIFEYVAKSKRKPRKLGRIEKVAVVNRDIPHAPAFLQYSFDECFTFGIEKNSFISSNKEENNLTARDESVSKEGLHFFVGNKDFFAPMYGEYNVMNILAAITVAQSLGVDWKTLQASVAHMKNVPGRIELIEEAKEKGFNVIVDYAFEPIAMAELYEVVKMLEPKRIIHVFGSTGGGRDVERRFTVGELVGCSADICIVTDEDPYDDNPMDIINDVASAVEKTGKVEGKNLFKIVNRREAIAKALSLAQEGDLVLVTGKGSEQAMVVKGELVPWDDRKVIREELRKK